MRTSIFIVIVISTFFATINMRAAQDQQESLINKLVTAIHNQQVSSVDFYIWRLKSNQCVITQQDAAELIAAAGHEVAKDSQFASQVIVKLISLCNIPLPEWFWNKQFTVWHQMIIMNFLERKSEFVMVHMWDFIAIMLTKNPNIKLEASQIEKMIYYGLDKPSIINALLDRNINITRVPYPKKRYISALSRLMHIYLFDNITFSTDDLQKRIVDMIHILADAGVDMNENMYSFVKDKPKNPFRTALHLLVSQMYPRNYFVDKARLNEEFHQRFLMRLPIIFALIERGADINLDDNKQTSFLEYLKKAEDAWKAKGISGAEIACDLVKQWQSKTEQRIKTIIDTLKGNCNVAAALIPFILYLEGSGKLRLAQKRQ